MERFWASREFIEVGSAPEQLVKEARRPAKETGPQGAMAQLRGMVDHDDVRPVLNRISRPLVLLQSKRSDFVPCELGPDALDRARVDRETTAAKAVRTGGTVCSVEYVDCGHEMNQEKRAVIARTLFDVLRASVEEEEDGAPAPAPAAPVAAISNRPLLDLPDVAPAPAPESQAVRVAREREELEDAMRAAMDAEDASLEQAEESAEEESDDESFDSDALSESGEDDDDDEEEDDEPQDDAGPKRKRRSTRGASEKRRRRAAKRKIQALRDEHAKEQAKVNEREERFAMRYEDFRSRQVRKDLEQLRLFEEGADRALEKAEYIEGQRDDEDARQIAHRLAVLRTRTKVEKRARDRAQEGVMLAEAVALDGEKSGGYLSGGLERFVHGSTSKNDARCPPMREVAASGKRMTDDLFESRKRLVLALQQSQQLESVVDRFGRAAEAADHAGRKLQRTLRLLESNRGLRGALAPKQREIDELREAHGAKVEEYPRPSGQLGPGVLQDE